MGVLSMLVTLSKLSLSFASHMMVLFVKNLWLYFCYVYAWICTCTLCMDNYFDSSHLR